MILLTFRLLITHLFNILCGYFGTSKICFYRKPNQEVEEYWEVAGGFDYLLKQLHSG